MAQHIEPCPKCGAEVRRSMGFNESEDVRWAEYECDCGLSFYAESRIVDENGVHDDLAEYGDLLIQWNIRKASRRCSPVPVFRDGSPWPVMTCSECGRDLHYDDTEAGCVLQPFCGCGAKVVG